MRKATKIELYDAGVILGSITGIFTEYAELESFVIDGDNLAKFYQILGIEAKYYSNTSFSHKEKKEVTNWYEPEYLDLTIERRLKSELWRENEVELQAEILPNGLLNILVTWENGSRNITYSGRFAIEWANEND